MRDFKAGDRIKLKKGVLYSEMHITNLPLKEIIAVADSDYVIVEETTKNHLVKIFPLTEAVGFYWNKEWFEHYIPHSIPNELFEIKD